jgi:predicted nucleotidyltransferase
MLQKSSINQTLNHFFLYPTKAHYLMDMSRSIGIAHTSIKKNLKELLKLKIIKEQIEKKGGRKFPIYSTNLENKLYKRYKIISNFTSLLESGIVDYLTDRLAPKSMILFGSYARGEDTESSDIDLFLECNKEELQLRPYEKKLGRKIELHFNSDFLTYPSELKNNLLNGIILSGYLEVFR